MWNIWAGDRTLPVFVGSDVAAKFGRTSQKLFLSPKWTFQSFSRDCRCFTKQEQSTKFSTLGEICSPNHPSGVSCGLSSRPGSATKVVALSFTNGFCDRKGKGDESWCVQEVKQKGRMPAVAKGGSFRVFKAGWWWWLTVVRNYESITASDVSWTIIITHHWPITPLPIIINQYMCMHYISYNVYAKHITITYGCFLQ